MVYLIERTPQLIAGTLILLVAIGLALHRPKHRLHQALFLVLWFVAIEKIVSPFIGYEAGSLFDRLTPYLAAGVTASTWAFAILFWRAHQKGARRIPTWVAPACLGTGLAIMLSMIVLPGFWALHDGVPIDALFGIRFLSLAALGTVSALLAIGAPMGNHRRSLVMLAAAFALEPAYRGVFTMSRISGSLDWFAWIAIGWVVLGLVTAGILAVRLSRVGLAATIVGAGLLGAVPYVLGNVQVGLQDTVLFGLQAALGVVSLLMIVYALIHCRVFAIDLRLKYAMRQSLVAALLSLVFLTATETVEFLLPDTQSLTLSIVAGVLVALLFQPLQKVARVATDAILPRIENTPSYRTHRAQDLYQTALEDAVIDGRLTVDEERNLIALQRTLGLPTADAVKLERRTLEGHTISEYRAI